jgi:hypothetical protein
MAWRRSAPQGIHAQGAARLLLHTRWGLGELQTDVGKPVRELSWEEQGAGETQQSACVERAGQET